jgi:three-Cys-motif partner protein
MPLEFKQDAICLSGLTGSKLKCAVIGRYYPFWWGITSGGPIRNYEYPTTIVELDAATGEGYINETNEVILGSSGHALDLKCNRHPDTRELKIVLVEKDVECYSHLKNVIQRRWVNVDIAMAEGPIQSNQCQIYLLNMDLDNAINAIGQIKLGNALFFFDPLRNVEYIAIEKVARQRINSYYRKGTEFIIFVFTSDWFLGRDDFAPLPKSIIESAWSISEKESVSSADAFFGNKHWRDRILNDRPIHEREKDFVELYREVLHKWFRYTLPLPFNPKPKQVYHLILSSNYEAGVRATRNFYAQIMDNPRYSPDINQAYKEFRKFHPDILSGLNGRQRPLHWHILRRTITDHEEGICDCECSDFLQVDSNSQNIQLLLDWLEEKNYLVQIDNDNAWQLPIKKYRLNWATINKLGINPPSDFEPLSLKRLSLEEISQ